MNPTRLARRARAAFQIPVVFARAITRYGPHISTISRKLLLSLKHRYEPKEALAKQLLDPSLPDTEFDLHISRSDMSQIQGRYNPASWDPVLADKSIFYRYCTVSGIPVPTLYAVFCRGTPGWVRSGRLLVGRDEWGNYLMNECPPDIVVKPGRGVYGQGVTFLTRKNGAFADNYGARVTAAALYDRMASDRKHETFVIQERLRNHPALARLSGTEALQTLRMTTVLQPDGKIALAWTHLKLIGGEHFVDNYRYGALGNLMSEVDIDTGVVRQVLLSRNRPVTHHPKTSLPILGFQIPCWTEARALVERSARMFVPVGTIGWDIAITPTGPAVIEGNIWYDPPSAPDIASFLKAFRPSALAHESA